MITIVVTQAFPKDILKFLSQTDMQQRVQCQSHEYLRIASIIRVIMKASHTPLKRPSTLMKLHGAKPQKAVIFMTYMFFCM
jgi:hypothetical protein